MWTPVQYYSAKAFACRDDALTAATGAVTWLAGRFKEPRPG